MSVWLETVPALLQQLNVEYVAIVTHSAGTVYTLNTLYHHRSILDPKAPFVAFLGSCSAVGGLYPYTEADNDNSPLGVYRSLWC